MKRHTRKPRPSKSQRFGDREQADKFAAEKRAEGFRVRQTRRVEYIAGRRGGSCLSHGVFWREQ